MIRAPNNKRENVVIHFGLLENILHFAPSNASAYRQVSFDAVIEDQAATREQGMIESKFWMDNMLDEMNIVL